MMEQWNNGTMTRATFQHSNIPNIQYPITPVFQYFTIPPSPPTAGVRLTPFIRSAKDFWTGLIYIFFGSSAILIAREYGMGTGIRMGPAYFPTVLGGLLVCIGAISVIRSFIVSGPPIGGFAFKGLALVTASVLVFGLIVRGAGLAVALPLLVVISAYASTRFRWRPTILIAAGLTIFCVLVFLKGLGIPLPVIGPWFGG
jgi:hypothetical protein